MFCYILREGRGRGRMRMRSIRKERLCCLSKERKKEGGEEGEGFITLPMSTLHRTSTTPPPPRWFGGHSFGQR